MSKADVIEIEGTVIGCPTPCGFQVELSGERPKVSRLAHHSSPVKLRREWGLSVSRLASFDKPGLGIILPTI